MTRRRLERNWFHPAVERLEEREAPTDVLSELSVAAAGSGAYIFLNSHHGSSLRGG